MRHDDRVGPEQRTTRSGDPAVDGPVTPQAAPSPCGVAGSPEELPLVALLGRAHDAFADAVDDRLRASPFPGISLAHSRNVLRHLMAGPLRASQLVAACHVTKQAISQQLGHLQRRGYVEVTPDPHDHRARQVALTDTGRAAQVLVAEVLADVEGEWRAALGSGSVEQIRLILARAPGLQHRG